MSKTKAPAEPIARTVHEYRDLLTVRATAYAEHVKTMTVDPALRAWAQRMTDRNKSPVVKVWHNLLPWLEALLVVRYGEAVEHWPKATTVADYGRAQDWEAGKEEPFAIVRARSMTLGG